MIKRIKSGWNVLRWVRLVFGTAAVLQGILQQESLFVVAGIAILLGTIVNVGFCGSHGCPVPPPGKERNKKIEHEEVVNAK